MSEATLQLQQLAAQMRRPAQAQATGREVSSARDFDRRASQAENAARQATSEHQLTTRGAGMLRVPAPIKFDIPFLSEPHYSNGSALIDHPDPDIWEDPVAVMAVRRWQRNDKGHWVGAYVTLKVSIAVQSTYTIPVLSYPDVTVLHYASFSGMAFKDMGSALSSKASRLKPRVPGFGSSR